jgi:hypothetical protein
MVAAQANWNSDSASSMTREDEGSLKKKRFLSFVVGVVGRLRPRRLLFGVERVLRILKELVL